MNCLVFKDCLTICQLLHKHLQRWIWIIIPLVLGLSTNVNGQYYGMRFAGHEYPLNQRSGLNLTPNKSLRIKDNVDLEFFIRLAPDHNSYYGYVFRMVIGNKNIDLVHGVVRQNPNNFELILGDETSKIAFPISIERLCNDWVQLRFNLDFENETITCIVDGEKLSDNLTGFNFKNDIRIMFGAHSFENYSSTDVPSMIIRDVSLSNEGHRAYHWKLDETEGITVHSVPAGYEGKAVNPDWLLKHHNSWKKVLDLQIIDTVKTCFDAKNENLYIVSPDTVFIYNVKNDSLQKIAQQSPSSLSMPTNVIFDPVSERLLLYSIDNNYVSIFDPESAKWSSAAIGTEPLTHYWHHNRYIDPEGKLTILGGYGYHLYKDDFKEWNATSQQFERIPYSGKLDPRYLAGMGVNPSDSMLYIIGGYGSESGKQSESPDYYYEILKYSPQDSTFSRVFQFSETDAGFCFANSLFFDDDNNLYGLYFSKYKFDNALQLVKIPLDNPEIIELGNPVTYQFIDVNSFADLYYSNSLDALVAIASFTSDMKTSFAAYTIAFPPQPFEPEEAIAENEDTFKSFYPLIAALGVGLVSLLYWYFSTQSKVQQKLHKKEEALPLPIEKVNKNAILLFGGFQVFDKQGDDITGRFTPLLKRLFLYIMLHSIQNKRGVSSKTLYENFWFDKTVAKARNNRAVNIVKLRNILESLATTSISKDNGYWKFDFDPSVLYIDYFEYMRIVRSKTQLTREDIVSLLSMVENKPFLINLDEEWLDSFKSDISNEIIDIFINYIGTSKDDSEFLLHLTNSIFIFDPISEEALKLRCKLLIKQGKHSLANMTYMRFINEYKHLYGEEFDQSLNEIIEL